MHVLLGGGRQVVVADAASNAFHHRCLLHRPGRRRDFLGRLVLTLLVVSLGLHSNILFSAHRRDMVVVRGRLIRECLPQRYGETGRGRRRQDSRTSLCPLPGNVCRLHVRLLFPCAPVQGGLTS